MTSESQNTSSSHSPSTNELHLAETALSERAQSQRANTSASLRQTLARPVFVLAGLILLAAAVLKLRGQDMAEAGASGLLAQPGVQSASVVVELALAAWLFSFWQPWVARLVSVVFFGALAVVSLTLAIQGRSACDCFGRLEVHPWATFSLDVAILSLMILARPLTGGRVPDAAKCLAGGSAILAAASLVVVGIGHGDVVTGLARLSGQGITISPAYSDIGNGVRGEVRQFNLRVENRTGRSIVLTGGSSNCSCAVTDGMPVSVPASTAAVVPVAVRFTGTEGLFRAEYFLFTDDPEHMKLTARFGGRVVER